MSNYDDEDELQKLRTLVCRKDFGGMDDFSQERSHILNLTYNCMRQEKKRFGQCQKEAWEKYRDAIEGCI
jgi:hypothetical protein